MYFFFCKEPANKHFGFCKLHSLFPPLKCSLAQMLPHTVPDKPGCVPVKLYLQKRGGGWDLALGPCLPTPGMREGAEMSS